MSAHTVAAAPSRHRAAAVRPASSAPATPSPAADWARLVVASVARGLVATLLGLAFWAVAPLVVGWQPTTTVSGSMMPRIEVGDVVISKPVPETDLRVGQVLLMDDPDQAGHLRFHRFAEPGDDGMLVTKGDANPQADSTPVARDAVHGVGVLRVPWVGLPVTWAREGDVARLVLLAASIAVLMALATLDGPLRRRVEQEAPAASGAPGGAGVAGTGPAPVAPGPGVAPAASGPVSRRAVRHRRRAARRRKGAAGGIAVVVAVVGMTSLLPAEAVAAPFRATTSATTGTLTALTTVAPTAVKCSPPTSGTASVVISWAYPSTEPDPTQFEVVATSGSTSTVLGQVDGTVRTFTYSPRGLLNLGSSATVTVRTVQGKNWVAPSTTGVPVRMSSLLGITNMSCG